MADVKITPKSKDTAIKLLALADKLDLDRKVIRSQNGGYLVPEEIAKELDSENAPKKARAPKAKDAKSETKADDTKEGND